MKVLNVVGMLNPLLGGGTAERTRQMSLFQHQAGIECTILTVNEGIDEELIRCLKGIEIVALPYISRRFYVPLPLFLTISRLVKSSDIIHLMNHWSILNVLVYLCIKLHKKPYAVCPAGALKKFGRSVYLKTIYNWLIGREMIKKAALCIAVTQDEVAHFVGYGVPSEDVTIIPNGVVVDGVPPDMENDFRVKYNLIDKPYILFMGRLNSIKGPDLLVDAFFKWHVQDPVGYHLVVAGADDGLLSVLRKKVVAVGLEDVVHFIGFVTGEEKMQAYCSASMLVIPSRSEAMSIVVLEAGIMGTPVLVTDMCGLNDLSKNECGWVCSASVDGIYAGLSESLTSRDKVTRGQNLKSYVEDNFEWSTLIAKYTALYKAII
jgi:glycosyltransferase involved in cell wall biosynthesis